jgi:protein gp37
MNDIWNPWHECKKYSEGCENCYMYYLDRQRDKDGSDIYKVKTNFNLPLKKDREGNYKVKSGESLRVCMTSDFFLEEADEWRKDVWPMMKQRSDVNFFLLTKRAERIQQCLPEDWGEGYDNVSLNITTENQKRADKRFPILLSIPAKHKGAMAAPLIGPIDLEKYLASGQIESLFADGENYDGARPLHYELVKSLYDQCVRQSVPFSFFGVGNVFIKDGKTYHVCKAYQHVEALKSGLQYPASCEDTRVQKKCKTCERRNTCNGCKWCGRCQNR